MPSGVTATAKTTDSKSTGGNNTHHYALQFPAAPGCGFTGIAHHESLLAYTCLLPPLHLQVPELLPSLSTAAYGGEGEEGGVTGREAATPVTVSAVTTCVLDLDPAEVPEHLAEVSAALKLEVGVF